MTFSAPRATAFRCRERRNFFVRKHGALGSRILVHPETKPEKMWIRSGASALEQFLLPPRVRAVFTTSVKPILSTWAFQAIRAVADDNLELLR